MPKVPIKTILKEIFSKGVGSVGEKELAEVFASKGRRVYRTVPDPEKFLMEGWNPKGAPFRSSYLEKDLAERYPIEKIREWQRKGEVPKEVLREVGWKEGVDPFDYSGLYWWTKHPKSDSLREWQDRQQYLPPWHQGGEVVEGVRRPGSQVMQTAPDYGEGATRFNEWDQPDFLYRQSFPFNEMIQQEPGNVLAKWKNLIKIIGLGTLMNKALPEENR